MVTQFSTADGLTNAGDAIHIHDFESSKWDWQDVYEKFTVSHAMVEICMPYGFHVYRVRSHQGSPFAACGPDSCTRFASSDGGAPGETALGAIKGVDDALIADAIGMILDAYFQRLGLAHENGPQHRNMICGSESDKCPLHGVTRMGSWRELDVDVAIVGFPRAGTTALYHHLVLNSYVLRDGKNNQVGDLNDKVVSFDIPNSARLFLDRPPDAIFSRETTYSEFEKQLIIGEDSFFEYQMGWEMFPTHEQVLYFNSKVTADRLNQYRERYNISSSSKSGSRSRKIIKLATAFRQRLPMIRILGNARTKIILQLPDMMRYIDREFFDHPLVIKHIKKFESGEYDLDDPRRYCNITADGNTGLISLEKFGECLPEVFLVILGDDRGMVDLETALDFFVPYGLSHERLFLLHKEWLDTDGDAAMRSLEQFLQIDANALGSWPQSPKKSRWRTDICTSPYYHAIKNRVLAQYPKIIAMLVRQGHWVPPNLLNGITSCDEYLIELRQSTSRDDL